MKTSLTILALFMFLCFSSCNSSNTQEKKAADTTATVATTKPAFTPFNVLTVTHKVKNFAVWKAGYLSHDSMRNAYGLTHYALGREMEDSNLILVIIKAADIAKAKEFTASPDLKAAMQRGGVTGKPVFGFGNVIRNDDSKIDQKDRVMITHKVKDFDAWLKVFDSDSKNRTDNGLIDRGLARDAADSNTVHIVFAITDMNKAKAMMNSPELKKKMTEGGVQGAPTFFFYKLVE